MRRYKKVHKNEIKFLRKKFCKDTLFLLCSRDRIEHFKNRFSNVSYFRVCIHWEAGFLSFLEAKHTSIGNRKYDKTVFTLLVFNKFKNLKIFSETYY